MTGQPGSAGRRADAPPPQVSADRARLEASIRRLLQTAEALADEDIRRPSGLPGWSRAHVLTHLARAADARTGLLAAARAGTIGRQYPSEESRAGEIAAGARRPGRVVRADLREALDRFRAAADGHPAGLWDALGEWLGGRRQPVHRVLPGLHKEIEYHHVDLRAGYVPADWPREFTASQLDAVTRSMTGRADCPAVTIRAPEATYRIRDGALATISGGAPDLLAWLTGRGDGRQLQQEPGGPLPAMPPLG